MDRQFNLLFVCADNAAHSIIAEALINRVGLGRFNGYSAGLTPGDAFDSDVLMLLGRAGYQIDRPAPVSWRHFAWPGAPELDLVIYLRDRSPIPLTCSWQGMPRQLVWNIPSVEPTSTGPASRLQATRTLFRMIEQRTSLLASLPDSWLVQLVLRDRDATPDRGRVHEHVDVVPQDGRQVANVAGRTTDSLFRSAS